MGQWRIGCGYKTRVEIVGVREESNNLAMYIKSSPTHEWTANREKTSGKKSRKTSQKGGEKTYKRGELEKGKIEHEIYMALTGLRSTVLMIIEYFDIKGLIFFVLIFISFGSVSVSGVAMPTHFWSLVLLFHPNVFAATSSPGRFPLAIFPQTESLFTG